MRKIIIFLMVFSFLLPIGTLAASMDLSPEFNTLCWKEEDCKIQRAQILGVTKDQIKSGDGGWIQEDPCTGKYGKCLPAGKTKTKIAFGGKQEFADIGEFIKTNYNLAVTIAGILAVLMIIVAGVQWVTSGGNSEMISSAKKRIGGALVGLLIAYLSYTILNTINPALVNLRLPQNYLIRPFKLAPKYCRDAEATNFALAAKKGQQVSPEAFKNIKMEEIKKDTMVCGDQYFIEGSGAMTCLGAKCEKKGDVCMPVTFDGDNVKNEPNCDSAQLVVHYSMDQSLLDVFYNMSWWTKTVEKDDWIDDGLAVFWPVCETAVSKKIYIGDKWERWGDSGEGMQMIKIPKKPFYEYYLKINNLSPYLSSPAHDEDHWNCYFKGDRVVGFVFKTEMGKASGWFGGLDSNFYSSPKPYVGTWDSISKNGYITFKQLEDGLMFESVLTSDVITSIADHSSTEPAKLYVDGKEIFGNHVDPDKNKVKTPLEKYEEGPTGAYKDI
jgi:hypothetical protein